MSYQRGDVVWGSDPFKSGENPRPWLILNNDTHPFGEEHRSLLAAKFSEGSAKGLFEILYKRGYIYLVDDQVWIT
ncbi:hypothetical protein [Halegenticoccus tardaugens]|uniref:hypothetical protein n=1 Tax=Halegenticoccus tardaugens TaxID=2071624 RepID=UPI00100B6B1F|nr:hypothetical protein [Halegenticoccus tardaugens]